MSASRHNFTTLFKSVKVVLTFCGWPPSRIPSYPICGIHGRSLGPAAENSGRLAGGGRTAYASCTWLAHKCASHSDYQGLQRNGIEKWRRRWFELRLRRQLLARRLRCELLQI